MIERSEDLMIYSRKIFQTIFYQKKQPANYTASTPNNLVNELDQRKFSESVLYKLSTKFITFPLACNHLMGHFLHIVHHVAAIL